MAAYVFLALQAARNRIGLGPIRCISGSLTLTKDRGQVPLKASDPHSLDMIPRAYRNLPARGGYSPCSTAKRPSVRGSVPATRPCRKNPYSPFTGSSERGSEDRELSHRTLSTSKGRKERRIERAGAKFLLPSTRP